MGDNPADWAKLGYGGVLIIPFILYKVYQMLKSDKQSDNNTNRIDAFYGNLQTQMAAMGLRLDAMREENNKLVSANALLTAKLEIAKEEVENMKLELEKHIAQIKYLRGLCDEKGVKYV